jgi:hypothetical protein
MQLVEHPKKRREVNRLTALEAYQLDPWPYSETGPTFKSLHASYSSRGATAYQQYVP